MQIEQALWHDIILESIFADRNVSCLVNEAENSWHLY